MRVKVYRNLHRNCYSVVCMESGHPMKGRVIAHKDIVRLLGAEFRVSAAGRQRVLRERRKNVHAYVIGEWEQEDGSRWEEARGWTHLNDCRAHYNPYQCETFECRDGWGVTDGPLHTARAVLLGINGVRVWGPNHQQEAAA